MGTFFTVLGSLAALTTFALLGVYLGGLYVSSPKLLVRLGSAKDLHVRVPAPNGILQIGVSAANRSPVLLTECALEYCCDNLHLTSPEVFEPSTVRESVRFTWKGTERLEEGQFFGFFFDYHNPEPVERLPMKVTFVCSIPPEIWRFPWSIYSLQPKRRTYHFEFTCDPNVKESNGIRIGPKEGLRATGPVAKRAFTVHGLQDLKVTEVFQDGTHRIARLKSNGKQT